ncbi:MAG: saccharopine dehydrogenase C-terminal domain-containing protein [Acidobacteriota bacterium]|jgi:saccharopine dehydrogenase-like NADP-dependent oxidoreductase
MRQICVLGGGRVGSLIARDLSESEGFAVRVADLSKENLARLRGRNLEPFEADLSEPAEIRRAIAGADLVIGAVPSFLGFEMLETVLGEGKNIVDISFFEEDPFELQAAAEEQGVTAVIDCGIAPGTGNLILGHVLNRVDRVERYLCYVGGLPAVRVWPWEYKAPFCPDDVIEEYTRPTRLKERGEIVVRPALSDLELVDLPGIGTLEAFNTDGLRTLLETVDVPWMQEKTMRYPGHVDRMRALRETGFFGEDPVEIAGPDGPVQVQPREFTSALLFDAWDLGDADDLVIERVIMDCEKDGKAVRYTYDMLDRRDPETRDTAMARTTGFTCAAAARALADGLWTEPGIVAPEVLGQNEDCYQAILRDLERRGVTFRETVDEL